MFVWRVRAVVGKARRVSPSVLQFNNRHHSGHIFQRARPMTSRPIWPIVGQRASYSSWGGSSSGQGQHHDWIRSVMTAMTTTKESLTFDYAAFHHPDDKDNDTDLRDAIPYPLTPDEMLAIADLIANRITYVRVDCSERHTAWIKHCMDSVKLLRLHCTARKTGKHLPLKDHAELSQHLLAFSLIYYKTPVGSWIHLSKKDADALWELQRTLERIHTIARINLVLRSLLKPGADTTGPSSSIHTPGSPYGYFSFDTSASTNGSNGTDQNLPSPFPTAKTLRHGAFIIMLALGDLKYLEKEWFNEKEKILLMSAAGKLRKMSERMDPDMETVRVSRQDVEDIKKTP